ncbi:hypothetical protein D044_2246B, partial [Vibrio parahaemolyticus EKP-026]
KRGKFSSGNRFSFEQPV